MTQSRFLDWLARDLEAPMAPAERAAGDDLGPDLVIGYGTGYGVAELSPFVRSLRAFSKARIALVASATPEVKAFLAQERVDRFDAPRDALWAPHLLIGRFKHYLSILDHYRDARRVLICDVRDLAFQGDPFARGYPDDTAPFAAFAETPPGALGDHGANPRWLDTLVGAPLAARLHEKPCVCGGTIMGEPGAMKRAMRILLSLCAIQRSGALEGIGADQAALNVIVHWDLAPAYVAANYGRVATIGHATPPNVRDGVLYNPDNTVSPIVHQYDRHAEARAAIETRWRIGEPQAPRPRPKGVAKWRKSWAKRWPDMR
jgi:hypothetical protein